MWKLLQKLRVALAEDDDAFPLRGVIEADEAYVGGKGRAGHGGRSLKDHRRSLVVCAVERYETGAGNPGIRGSGLGAGSARLRVLPRAGGEELQGFLAEVCASETTVRSDGWSGYIGLAQEGFGHHRVVVGDNSARASEVLPVVHTLFSNMQSWLVGTFHGVSRMWLPRYLQEFTWRFNRRFHEPRLWSYLLRRAVKKPWGKHDDVPAVAPPLQVAA